MEQTQQSSTNSQRKGWYDKYYKFLMLIPLLLVISSIVYLGIFYSQNNDIILRDVSLSGGTTITLNGEVNTQLIEQNLKFCFETNIITYRLEENRHVICFEIFNSIFRNGFLI